MTSGARLCSHSSLDRRCDSRIRLLFDNRTLSYSLVTDNNIRKDLVVEEI